VQSSGLRYFDSTLRTEHDANYYYAKPAWSAQRALGFSRLKSKRQAGSRSLSEAKRILLRLNSVVGAKGFGPSRLKSGREAGSRSLWEAERILWIGKSFQLVYLRKIDLWLSVWANWLMAGCFSFWLFWIGSCLVILRLRAKLDTHRGKEKKNA